MTQVALLGSVFLPAAVLTPLADELGRHGAEVTVADVVASGDPAQVLTSYAAALGDRRWDVVVAHSNAGLYVPAVVTSTHVARAVFMDAVLPGPTGGQVPVVPESLRGPLRELATDDLLPRWTEWWPPQDVRALFPDARTHADVHAATPRVPAPYLDGVLTVPAGWTSGVSGGFLAYGDTYDAERQLAISLGWPTRTLPLGHLGFLTDPVRVAHALRELVTAAPDPS